MKKDIKTKWLEALRSGKYQQGRGVLRRLNDTYCCLGVLCDILGPTKWKPKFDGTTETVMGWNGEVTLLSVCELAEIELSSGNMFDLVNLNDAGKSFVEIANYIEENL
jgi:hypothetical protein